MPGDWVEAARQLAADWHHRPWHPEVWQWLQAHPQASVAIACSGGADSLTLLLLAHSRLPTTHPLQVVHFNHKLRGEESAADAAFVRSVACALGREYLEGTPEQDLRGSSEAGLRRARLQFYHSLQCTAVLQGHILSDVAETQLMRLGRGSGCAGLAAPRPVSHSGQPPVFLRPLLAYDKDQVCNALRNCGIDWREDASNKSRDYYRNRIRNDVLPRLQATAPGNYLEGCGRARALAGEASDAIEHYADAWIRRHQPTDTLNVAALRLEARAVIRVVLHHWLGADGSSPDLNARGFERLLHRIQCPQPFYMSAGRALFLQCDGNALTLVRPDVRATTWMPCVLTPGQTLYLPDGASLDIRAIKLDGPMRRDILNGRYPPQRDAFFAMPQAIDGLLRLRVRQWRDGDRYRPLGAPGSRKLHDLWTDRKIPPKERKRLPVVCDVRDQPVWTPGLPCADSWKLKAESKSALWLTYRPIQ